MEETLQALGQILLQALPTFFLVLFLHFFLKAVFFKPLGRILHDRREATEGARRQADASLQRAQEKAAAYEDSLRAARNQLYKEQEEQRRQWREEQSKSLAQARSETEVIIRDARAQLASEAAAAREALDADSERLAEQIAGAVLERKAL